MLQLGFDRILSFAVPKDLEVKMKGVLLAATFLIVSPIIVLYPN